jgi:iron complex transport system substrate-binding protein
MQTKLLQVLQSSLLFWLLFSYLPACAQDAPRKVVDSAGRRIEIPQRISRILAAGPPASILLYTLAPEKMIGWVRTPSPAEKAFLAESVRGCLSAAAWRGAAAPRTSRLCSGSNPT